VLRHKNPFIEGVVFQVPYNPYIVHGISWSNNLRMCDFIYDYSRIIVPYLKDFLTGFGVPKALLGIELVKVYLRLRVMMRGIAGPFCIFKINSAPNLNPSNPYPFSP